MTEITIQTTIECCGELHGTPFCPMCGNTLASELPLVGLLKHVSKQATITRKSASGFRKHWARDVDQSESRVEWVNNRYSGLDAIAAKWESWRGALLEVVNVAKEQTEDCP